MEKFLLFYKRQWAVYTAVLVFVILSVICIINPFNFLLWFFGINNSKTPAEIISFIGVISGAILVIGTLYANNKRNYVMEKGQLDIRFKDAATLLASDNTSANLSGIYALHQIAIEASKDKNQNSYIQIVHDILCAFIRDNSEIENDENDEIIKYQNNKSSTVIQTILETIFKTDFYLKNGQKANFQKCVFVDLDIRFLEIREALFNEAILKNVQFTDAKLDSVYFFDAHIEDSVIFFDTKLCNVCFSNSFIKETHFNNSELLNVSFSGAVLDYLSFENTELNKVDFSLACFNEAVSFENIKFFEVDFSHVKFKKRANFTNTVLENCRDRDIVKSGFSLKRTKN